MDLLRFIPIRLTLVLVAGILLGKSLALQPGPCVLLAGLSLLLLTRQYYRNQQEYSLAFSLSAYTACLCLGMAAYTLSLPQHKATHYLSGNIPRTGQFRLQIRQVQKHTAYSHRYIADLRSANRLVVRGRVLLSFRKTDSIPQLRADDELLVSGTLEEIRPPRNPYTFDFREFMARKGIYHQLRPDGKQVLIPGTEAPTIRGRLERLRDHLRERLIADGIDGPELGVIQALIFGRKNDIPEETANRYKDAGALHILAVSGLHIGILLWLLHLLLRPLGLLPYGKRIKFPVILIILWSYAFLAGLSPSVIRAVSMFSFVAYALYLSRPANTFNILALSMFFVLLIIDPGLVFAVGFQLSYAAVFSIASLYPVLQRLWRPKHIVLIKCWQLISVSLAAQAGVLPISLFYFHQFPGLFLLSNLLVVPMLGIVLGGGFLSAGLSAASVLPGWLGSLYEKLVGLMNNLVDWVGQQEAFVFRDVPYDAGMLVLSYLILIALARLHHGMSFRRLALLLLNIAAMQGWKISEAWRTDGTEGVWVLHQYDNTLLFHRTGRHLSVSSGSGAMPTALISGFRTEGGVASLSFAALAGSYQWPGHTLYLIGENGRVPDSLCPAPYLLLRDSPHLNLDRVLKRTTPALVIADGSNYPSFVARWERSCRQMGIPFHHTGSEGALYLPIR